MRKRRIRSLAGAVFHLAVDTRFRPAMSRRSRWPGLIVAGSMSIVTPLVAQPIAIPTVEVGNPGNAPDPIVMGDGSTGFGDVDDVFEISTIEITNTQYLALLNAVAASDPGRLFNLSMGTAFNGGITRSGVDGFFTYELRPGFENKPVLFVSFFDAARFANWLHNGQPTGPQGPGTTEDGAYTMLGPVAVGPGDLDGNGRNSGWLWAVPTEDEWHKAAFGNAGDVWTFYATQSNVSPTSSAPPGTPNSANYNGAVPSLTEGGAYTTSPSFWGTFDQNGNVLEYNEGDAGVRRNRGGSWDTPRNALVSSERGFVTDGSFEDNETGFRVVRAAGAGPNGACCLADLTCIDALTEAGCTGLGGVYAGDGTLCIADPCGEPTGACCLTDGGCLDATTEADCQNLGGLYEGDGVTCAGVVCRSLANAGFLAVSFAGDAYQIQAPGGTGSLLGPTGWTQLNSMARNAAGQFITANNASPARLLEIDPATGLAAEFHIPFLSDIRALAFSPNDELYAIENGTDLYFLDLAVLPGDSSIAILIGQLMIIGMQGMAFAPDGTLYGWSVSRGLVTIDLKTAEATDVNAFADGTSEIQTLAFAPDGALYGVQDALYLVDLQTGAIAQLGSGGYGGIRGFEALPCPGDVDADGTVGILDFLALLASWGPCAGCAADLDDDGIVGIVDFLALLAAWGPCP